MSEIARSLVLNSIVAGAAGRVVTLPRTSQTGKRRAHPTRRRKPASRVSRRCTTSLRRLAWASTRFSRRVLQLGLARVAPANLGLWSERLLRHWHVGPFAGLLLLQRLGCKRKRIDPTNLSMSTLIHGAHGVCGIDFRRHPGMQLATP